MENWDFDAWQVALGGLDPRAAALVGLAAAERISGCLGDERFRRYGGSGSEVVRDLLYECWVSALSGEVAASVKVRELANQLESHSSDYLTRSLTDLFRTYGPAIEDDEDPDGQAAGLGEFLEEAEPEGAVMMHLDAMTAVSEAVVACAGRSWDGALRCLQITAMAASPHDPQLPGPGIEKQRQREDLALVQAAERAELSRLAADLRVRAQADSSDWKQVTEQLGLLHD